ncbi:MAG: hypothetical protein ABFE07_28375 [Armatimonadia bacterium]
MSAQGLALAARIFSLMQETRIELLRIGSRDNDHQDILLGQMLETGKDAMKFEFCKISSNPVYRCPRCDKSDRLEGHYYGDKDMDYCNRCEWSFFKGPGPAPQKKPGRRGRRG